MKKVLFGLLAAIFTMVQLGFYNSKSSYNALPADSLRAIYSHPAAEWPKPNVDSGVHWAELTALPKAPIASKQKELEKVIALGKVLFYDPRLSGSNQISCISCHSPDMNWADGKRVSLGHDQSPNQRNAPSLENVWYLKNLFWDGRAKSLEEQLEGPIGSDIEMHQDFAALPKKLGKINGYKALFTDAFGDKKITTERIATALADYQRTFTSRKSDFDYFMEGNSKRLTDQQIEGLHLFRTKARCMNCHYGPLFTDDDFHNLGLTYYGRDKYEDLGRYNITKKPEDVGKFKTPGLRNIMRTRPWFHNGLFDNIEGVINMYNAGMPQPKPRPDQLNDPLFPKTDPLIKRLGLSKTEKEALIAFLNSITTEPWRIQAPEMPK
ncbi:cytochrome-c peroxidase [Mucilaginibacter conchicola]|uniref:Methylamine utilization protein MauG n=1 Tax=Mucilaginibacter conchicola TaxID=2303333 RepID=A0A372NXP3_9SPHI|nr:cytochrome c peroxidase [Mucilaginibacter conchicola]RFZ94880.1 cytochrome-c peroxidase [Mucilaginibacter conchicola]